MISDERLKELRGIAEKAGSEVPGRWFVHEFAGLCYGNPLNDSENYSIDSTAADEHIAAFDPTTALALLDEIEKLKSALDAHKRVVQSMSVDLANIAKEIGFDSDDSSQIYLKVRKEISRIKGENNAL